MLTLGSSPNALRHPQNSLVPSPARSGPRGPPPSPTPSLVGRRPLPPASRRVPASTTRATRKSMRLAQRRAPGPGRRRAGRRRPAPKGTEMAGCPERFEGMVHTSFMYMAMGSSTLDPRSKAVVGAVAPRGRRPTRRPGRRPASRACAPAGPARSRRRSSRRRARRCQHHTALHLRPEARRCAWRCSWRPRPRRRPAGRSARRRSGPGWRRPRPGR